MESQAHRGVQQWWGCVFHDDDNTKNTTIRPPRLTASLWKEGVTHSWGVTCQWVLMSVGKG